MAIVEEKDVNRCHSEDLSDKLMIKYSAELVSVCCGSLEFGSKNGELAATLAECWFSVAGLSLSGGSSSV